jgi:hypothetical protein
MKIDKNYAPKGYIAAKTIVGSCQGCALISPMLCGHKPRPSCHYFDRPDGHSVIFKKRKP